MGHPSTGTFLRSVWASLAGRRQVSVEGFSTLTGLEFAGGKHKAIATMLTDELLDYLFDGHSHVLFDATDTWLGSSRRFAAFVNSFRDKIWKKIRVTKDTESILDLRLELETAYLLLQESRLNLVYEPQMSEKVRAPDFAVTFTTSVTFMLEVTRLRSDLQRLKWIAPR